MPLDSKSSKIGMQWHDWCHLYLGTTSSNLYSLQSVCSTVLALNLCRNCLQPSLSYFLLQDHGLRMSWWLRHWREVRLQDPLPHRVGLREGWRVPVQDGLHQRALPWSVCLRQSRSLRDREPPPGLHLRKGLLRQSGNILRSSELAPPFCIWLFQCLSLHYINHFCTYIAIVHNACLYDTLV